MPTELGVHFGHEEVATSYPRHYDSVRLRSERRLSVTAIFLPTPTWLIVAELSCGGIAFLWFLTRGKRKRNP